MGVEFLTVEEVAAAMRLNSATVYRMIQRGELPCIKFGRTYRIRKAEFLAMCEVQRGDDPRMEEAWNGN